VPVAGLSPSIVRKDTTHAPRVISPQNSFLITSTLHDVIQYGTATQARSLQRKDLAGKTGTTSNQVDAWFVGYNTDLVALSWVGFDQPQSLHEYGAQAALPIWINFMQEALRNKPEHMLEQPTGIKTILVNSYSGQRTSGHDPDGINEIFMEPYLPGEEHEHHHTAFGDNSNHDHEDDGSSGVGDQAPPDGDGGGVY
jgi:penicillin-binding protein 1A